MIINTESNFSVDDKVFYKSDVGVVAVTIEAVIVEHRKLYLNTPIFSYTVRLDKPHKTIYNVPNNALFKTPSEAFGIPTSEAFKVTVERM